MLFKAFPCYGVLKFHLARVSLLLTVALSEHLDAGVAGTSGACEVPIRPLSHQVQPNVYCFLVSFPQIYY